VLAVIQKRFTDNDGQEVAYDQVFLLNEKEDGEREVVQINSKLEGLTAYEGKDAVVGLEVDPHGTKKSRLVSIKDGN